MAGSNMKKVKVTCPWNDEHTWYLEIKSNYADAEAILDEIDGMLGDNGQCPVCGRGNFIHYLKQGERRLPRPLKGHLPHKP